MQNEKVPAWAFARANELAVKYGMEDEKGRVFDGPYTRPLQVAFARYIAEHEEPPVDPLVEALDEAFEATKTLSDTRPHRTKFAELFREALAKRGIELARKEDSHAG